MPERDDDALPADHLLQLTVQFADVLLILSETLPCALAHKTNQPKHKGENNHRTQGEPKIDSKHHYQNPDQRKHSSEQVRYILGKHTVDGVHVVRQTAHQLTVGVSVKKTNRECLQMFK